MIPLKDNLPTRHFPIISILLIAINVAVFAVDQLTGVYRIQPVQVGPDDYRRVLHFVGGLSERYAMIPAEVIHDPGYAWTTIFSSMFLHANWLHVGSNMLYLWIFGNNVEDTLGRFRFLLFYLICGVAAAMAHIASGPNSLVPTVGASGAVAGLMGAYLILFPHAEILAIVPFGFLSTLTEVPALYVIGFWALLQFLNANWLGGGEMRGGGVAYFAHLGGFVAGILLILLLGGRRLGRERRRGYDEPYYR